MKSIPLSRGYFATIDDDDFEVVSKYTWCLWQSKTRRAKYAITKIRGKNGGQSTLKMHKLIKPGVKIIDHKDGNGLNNQKSNLRSATNGQNRVNSYTTIKSGTGYVGVREEAPGRFRARMGNGGRINLGLFSSAEEAAKVRDAAILEKYEIARTNFG